MNKNAVLAVLFLLMCPPLGRARSSTSVCDLAKAPEQYNGQTITISGVLSVAMHANTVEDPHCNFSVLIEGKDAGKVQSDDREGIKKLWRILPKLRERHYDPNYPDYKPEVTLTGRFETTYRLQKGTRVSVEHGFGDHGLFRNRLILERVDKLPTLE
jgi:hypothetical protein